MAIASIRFCRVGTVAIRGAITILTGGTLLTGNPVGAQLQPDNTLGHERSIINAIDQLSDRIDGGASRGINLFHSFREFNVGEGRGVYFANPMGIENILSRVTGQNPSHILGRLGVLGQANLFLLNPNGILFGPHASLDIQGSFHASTASAISLGAQGVFSATDPHQSTLLSVNPGTLFFHQAEAQPGSIINQGHLAVGQNLTLSAHNLELQGQLLAGHHLTLQALDTLTIRDSISTPFIAAAGHQLWVEGNQSVDIDALNHPRSGLFSGGDTVLQSANPVIGDAHYFSGGDFRIEQLDGRLGDLLSIDDPIIRSQGDVNIDEYEGTSLHIFAGGEVNLNTVFITGPDTGDTGVDFIQETVQLSNGNPVAIDGSAQATLDIRAGVDPAQIMGPILTGFDPFLDAFPGFFAFVTPSPTSADITIGDVVIDPPDGVVLLTNQYQPDLAVTGGDITVNGAGSFGFGVNALGFGGDGSSVIVDARGDIVIENATIDASSRFGGNGGSVTLLAQGDISLNRGSSIFSDGLLGGPITLTSAGNLSVTGGAIGSETFAGAPDETSGGITLSAQSLFLNDGTGIFASNLGTGNAGAVKLTANDVIDISGVGTFGNISRVSSVVAPGATGSAGGIEITTGSLLIKDGARLSASTFGNGDAGVIQINADSSIVLAGVDSRGTGSDIFSQVLDNASGSSGGIEITTNSLSLNDGAQVSASTFGVGNAGPINITAHTDIALMGESDSGFVTIIASRVGDFAATGSSGGIEISTDTLTINDGARISASTFGDGNAGNITIKAQDSIKLAGEDSFGLGSAIFSQVQGGAMGSSGNIDIMVGSLTLNHGAEVAASTFGQGNAGLIQITAENTISLAGSNRDGDGSSISSDVRPGADGSSDGIDIIAESLTLRNNAGISASTSGMGNAGRIHIEVTDNIQLEDSGIFSQVQEKAIGSSGAIDISAGSLTLRDGATVSANTFGNGDSGLVQIVADHALSLAGANSHGRPSFIGSEVGLGATGSSEGLGISAESLFLGDGAVISATTFGDGNAGTIEIAVQESIVLAGENRQGTGSVIGSVVTPEAMGSSGGVGITTDSLSLSDGAVVSADTFGQGNAGSIRIMARDNITLVGEDRQGFASIITSRVTERAEGSSGGIEITTNSLSLNQGAQVSASTLGNGDAGLVQITADNAVSLVGTNRRGMSSIISSEVGRGAIGSSEGIVIVAESLSLNDGAVISATTFGQGDAGVVTIEVQDSIALAGENPLGLGSIIGSVVSSDAIGSSGGVEIITDSLSLNNGGVVSADTFGDGDSGSIQITARNRIALAGENSRGLVSSIASRVNPGAQGSSGGIVIHTGSLLLNDRAQVSAATAGIGDGGEVSVLGADTIALNNGTISTAVNPGAIAQQPSNIELQTRNLSLSNGSQITASTASNGSAGNILVREAQNVSLDNSTIASEVLSTGIGQGGNVEIHSGQLTLNHRSQISASSQGSGNAGNITINTSRQFSATNSDITTTAAQGSGGAIAVIAQDIRLRASDIETNVASGTGGGGDILLQADSIIAFGDSDILAFALDGRGGNITLDTSLFFGEGFGFSRNDIDPALLDGNGVVDINATGAISSGSITVPDVSFIEESLTELPTNLIDTTALIANSCIVRHRTQQGNFVITGAGSLAERPGDDAIGSFPTGTVQTVPSPKPSTQGALTRPWQLGDRIVEPQNVYRLPAGQLVMSRECSE